MGDNYAGTNGYKQKPKPMVFDGEKYDSQLEGGVAMMIHRAGIVYAPHVNFKVITRNCEWREYEVDFVFRRRQKLIGISDALFFLEVKGVFREHDKNRMEALCYTYDANGYVATTQLIKTWKRDGIVKDADRHVWLREDANINWHNLPSHDTPKKLKGG